MLARGTGWVSGPKLTTERFRASAAHVKAAAAAELPASFSLSRPLWILDQGQTEACTAFMGVLMLYALTGAKCSPWVPWWAGRKYDAPGQPLQNVGCSADGFTYGLEQDGACDLELWEQRAGWYQPLGTEDPPALARAAAQKRRLDLVPVYAVGADAVLALQSALVQGYPCGVVVEVDSNYEHPVNGFVGPETGPSKGRHAIMVDGYRTGDDGSIQFHSPGSWGPEWNVWLDESRIRTAPWLGFARLP